MNKPALNGALTLIITLILVCTIGTLAWVISRPVDEAFTEFYILGPGEMAEGYPRKLASGEEGELSLGIANHEHETMGYDVEMTVEGVPETIIGPRELAHGETWGVKASFILRERSARTRLAETVNPGTGPSAIEVRQIEVESSDRLEAGDFILLTSEDKPLEILEHLEIESIDGETLHLKDPVRQYHEEYVTTVTETRKIEFRLYKIRELNEHKEDHTTLSLWLGRENLSATITNQGQKTAEYEIGVEVRATIEGAEHKTREKRKMYSIGPTQIGTGSEWNPELRYIAPGAVWQNAKFSLYRNGQLIYHEEALGGYPSLHLWIEGG